jgi:CheY-like chemotaxis protein
MRALIADDDPVSCRLLEHTLKRWGHEVVALRDGTSAWEALHGPEPPELAILDWVMPGLNGPDLCRKVHELGRATVEGGRNVPHPLVRPYLILLTANKGKDNLITGLSSGADDYITKPFDVDELQARIEVGRRVIELQRGLAQRVRELEQALAQIKQLQGLLPICMYCKKVRDDQNYWQQVEHYIGQHTDARFSHGICPDCYEGVVKPEVERAQRDARARLAGLRPSCAGHPAGPHAR